MTAIDFLLYCTGTGVVLVSGAAAVRLIAGSRPHTVQSKPAPAPKWEPLPDPAAEGLADRLQAFQTTRFASPIVRRREDRPPTPGEPGGPRVVPPIRTLQPRTRPYSTPVQPKKPDDNVVPLPMKQRPEPKKED